MKFSRTTLEGVWVIESEQRSDERGYFMRAFCAVEFEEHRLPERFVQSSVSANYRAGTIRGLHFQWPPSREGKLIRCLSGAIHDVLVDLRPSSATFMQHVAIQLSESNALAVYAPEGFAHGFQVEEDGTRVLYQMTDVFEPTLGGSILYADPALGIRWPRPVTIVSERDRTAPPFDRKRYEVELERRTSGISQLP